MLKRISVLILLFVISKTHATKLTLPDTLSQPQTHLDSILLLAKKSTLDSVELGTFTNDFSNKSISIFFENENTLSAWKACLADDSLRKVDLVLVKTGNFLKRNPTKFIFLKNEISSTEKPKRVVFLERLWWSDSLKSAFDPLSNSSGFKTLGIDPSEVRKKLVEEMKTEAAAPQFVESILNSGASAPEKVEVSEGYTLYKIIPKGSPGPSLFTPFWTKLEELQNNLDTNLEQKFGLPVVSHGAKYDVYKIELKAGKKAIIFESKIAKTTENGYQTSGGATQSLVLDRSKWTFPTLETNLEVFPNLKK